MIIVEIKDPYEKGGYTVNLDESMPKERLQEIIDFLDSNTREIWASEGKERYHRKYSMDALAYEGVDYADTETPEDVLLRREEEPVALDKLSDEEQMNFYLSQLTETQQRRLRMRTQGLTYKAIAEAEGTDSSSVRESVRAAWKKLHKKFPEKFKKYPL